MLQATDEDAGPHQVLEGEEEEEGQLERSRQFPFDRSLISALVDRWRPKTHTFHMPFGEMAVTLQDVSMLTGLPISGDPPSVLQLVGSRTCLRGFREFYLSH